MPGDSDWLAYWNVLGAVAWIESKRFQKVTLQFPDELLAESTLVAAAIQHECVSRQILAQVSAQIARPQQYLKESCAQLLSTPADFSAG